MGRMQPIMQPIMSEADLTAFMKGSFPQAAADHLVERLTDDGIIMRLRVGEKHLRPGGTIVVSSSRAVLYAGSGDDFGAAAARVAEATRQALNAAIPR